MFTPVKLGGIGVLNETVLNTPQPQATSTVQRKYTLENKYLGGEPIEERPKQPHNAPTQEAEDSSLGLLHNMSVLTSISTADEEQKLNSFNANTEFDCVRKIVQRYNDMKSASVAIDTNKENNVNVQNITDVLTTSNITLPNATCMPDQNEECRIIKCFPKKASTTSIIFEPNEITARSSGINNTRKEQSLLNISCDGISFNTVTAEIMAKHLKELSKEIFLSDSQIPEKLLNDEASWQQNNTYAMPVANTEKNQLDFSSFCGITGDVDLSIASCAGQRVSVGQYFKRKCDNIGILGNDEKIRPNFGKTAETPITMANLRPFVDSSIMANEATLPVELKGHVKVSNAITDPDENSILSLSTIANTLQDVNIGTPRRLVDQLLMAQKKKKKYSIIGQGNNSTRKEIYALPSERNSMLARPNANAIKFDEDISLANLTAKLSLDSKSAHDVKTFSRMQSLASNKSMKAAKCSASIREMLKNNIDDKNATSSLNRNTVKISEADNKLLQDTMSISYTDKSNVFSCMPSKLDIKNYSEDSYSDLNIQDTKKIIKEDISNSTKNFTDSIMKRTEQTKKEVLCDLSGSSDDIIIGKNTEQLCNCIVGMMCQANIELINKANKWIRYSLNLSEVRGDQQSIILNVPQDTILIKPNGTEFTKIEIKVTKMCKPIIAVLTINASDMVAKSKWSKKHMICFKPEELELDIIYNSLDKQELNFEYITENSTKVLPVVFHNKNNIDVPIKLSILHDGPKMFSIDGTYNEMVKLNESSDELTHLVLKPQEKFSANIKCERLQLSDCSQKQPQYWKSKLIILVQCKDGTVLLTKEVPLLAQMGICKIQVVDTDIPIIVSKQQSKMLNIINSGNVTTHVSAAIVPRDGCKKAVHDFTIQPDDILLQPGERNAFLIAYKPQISRGTDARSTDERYAKVQLIAGNNVYYYIVEHKASEAEKENYLRCNTPCNLVSTSSPTSPQSVISSSRHSPSSTMHALATANIMPSIKSTHAALVWNSVKTGKSEIKEFTIRNISNNRIKIQIDICDDSKSFKFLGDRHTTITSMVLALQRTEGKMLRVMFNPYHVGPVAGKIQIKHYPPAREGREMQQYKIIPLYGYGGCGKVKISDTFKDANGKVWLSLGTLSSETTVLKAYIKVQNTGDLCSFAKIKVVPKVISPKMDSSWYVNPTEIILNPREDRRILIEFHPKKEDFVISQQSDVSHVATVNIIYGDESTRWRIRRLYNKIKESGELARNENETFKNIVQPICKIFSEEQLNPGLMSLRDPVQCLNDLCTGVQQYEIMLTVEACADDTLPILHDTADESQMYYSLISDDSHVDEMGGASFFVSQSIGGEYEAPQRDFPERLIVNPSTIELNPPVCNEATVTISNWFKTAQSFQTNLTFPNYFSVTPAEGILPSGCNFSLKIQCLQRIERNIQDVLEIYTENNKAIVLIKVHVKRR